mmetsp:Transcript_16128/g.44040  ORF Transcript_16128/g.44040 Transcript_16128/m.44040 type:complete len:257 (-) Transcript_16128:2220-2990(-)
MKKDAAFCCLHHALSLLPAAEAANLVRIQHILDCYHVWMVRAQRFLLDHKSALEQRPSHGIISLFQVQDCQIGERVRHFWMVRPEMLLIDRERPLVQWQRACCVSFLVVQDGKVAAALRHVWVPGPQSFLPLLELRLKGCRVIWCERHGRGWWRRWRGSSSLSWRCLATSCGSFVWHSSSSRGSTSSSGRGGGCGSWRGCGRGLSSQHCIKLLLHLGGQVAGQELPDRAWPHEVKNLFGHCDSHGAHFAVCAVVGL